MTTNRKKVNLLVLGIVGAVIGWGCDCSFTVGTGNETFCVTMCDGTKHTVTVTSESGQMVIDDGGCSCSQISYTPGPYQ